MKWRNTMGGVLEYSEEQIAHWRRLQELAGKPSTLAAFEEAHGLAFGAHRIAVDPASVPVRRTRASRLVPASRRCRCRTCSGAGYVKHSAAYGWRESLCFACNGTGWRSGAQDGVTGVTTAGRNVL